MLPARKTRLRLPTWASISTRFQPGVPDPHKIDSIYTGDWTSLGVTGITVDLNIIQVATWATDCAVTLELLQMDETGFNVTYDATYTLPDLPNGGAEAALLNISPRISAIGLNSSRRTNTAVP